MISHRRLLSPAVAVLAAALGVGAAAPAHAVSSRELIETEPAKIFAHAVTPDRAVVAVDHGTQDYLTRAVVTDADGNEVARTELGAYGQGLLSIALGKNSTRPVKVTLSSPGAFDSFDVEKKITLNTTKAGLAASPWRVVNKHLPMGPKDQPAKMTKVEGVPFEPATAGALTQLLTMARKDGLDIYPSNGFRAYGWQQGLYQSYVRTDGKAKADKYSARPGFSEHQTGLTFDAKARSGKCDLTACFGKTPEGKFLAKHAAETGFMVRYTEQSRPVTGYTPEPWHLRYVGTWLAGYLRAEGITSLEQAFGLPAAPAYRK